MILADDLTYYDLLELSTDASPQELRAAYLRAKAAYKKDSPALYTLITEEETEELLHRIEEAYQVLSNPERRRAYDRNHGLVQVEDEITLTGSRPGRNQKIISIDRVPPMESSSSDADILIPPSTDFGATPSESSIRDTRAAPAAASTPVAPRAAIPSPIRHSSDPNNDAALAQEIAQETEWRGQAIRKVRESRRVSVEELAEFTKISRTYLLAIEEENYARLPASVYLRGFLSQIAKYLKIPVDKVTNAYLSRVAQARVDK